MQITNFFILSHIKSNAKNMITKKQEDSLIDIFNARVTAQGLKGKTLLKAQQEFFVGATAMYEILNPTGKGTAMTPNIYYSILRGDRIKKIPA